MTEIYLHIDARMADYIRTHLYLRRCRRCHSGVAGDLGKWQTAHRPYRHHPQLQALGTGLRLADVQQLHAQSGLLVLEV